MTTVFIILFIFGGLALIHIMHEIGKIEEVLAAICTMQMGIIKDQNSPYYGPEVKDKDDEEE